MIDIIKQFLISKNIEILSINKESNGEVYFKCSVDNINYRKNINNVLIDFSYENSFLYTDFELSHVCNKYSLEFDVKIKHIKLKSIKPNRYIYHITNQTYVDNILTDGLKPNKLDGNLSNHQAIYFTNSSLRRDLKIFLFLGYYCTLLRIDTKKCNNTFYNDINDTGGYSDNNSKNKSIMTYENIPPEAIEIVMDMNISCDEYSMDLIKYFKQKKTI